MITSPVHFTKREQQILALLGEGCSNKVMAETLGLGEYTIKHYMTELFDKTGSDNRLDLLVWCIKKGLVTIEREEADHVCTVAHPQSNLSTPARHDEKSLAARH